MGGDRGPLAFFSEPLSGSLWKHVEKAMRLNPLLYKIRPTGILLGVFLRQTIALGMKSSWLHPPAL